LQLNQTQRFSVFDLSDEKESGKDHQHARKQTRLTKASGQRVDQAGGIRIGGDFSITQNPPYLQHRISVYDRIKQQYLQDLESKPRNPITISLPDGSTKTGTSWETTPLQIASQISNSLAKSIVVAKVEYASTVNKNDIDDGCSAGDGIEFEPVQGGILWDLNRPLVGDCTLRLLKFDDKEGQMVFWHSSAHCLGSSMECKFGCHLTIGPPVEPGFYYDCYMGENVVSEEDFPDLDKRFQQIVKNKEKFERLVVTKEEALELFQFNPFKVSLISTKIPEGGKTTVYRNGSFIDLCRGPHIPSSDMIKAYKTIRNSGTNWLGQVQNDSLQRVYGISFPDKALLTKWEEFQQQARDRDHRKLGSQQELFFFNELSPGSAFFLPHGARIYNRLIEFIRHEYWKRGYQEVVSPNVFNIKLWEISGHAQLYKDNMFTFDVENEEFGLKPMNCPGHCLIFGHRLRSYRELPIRMADFGVLHRNEISGSLTGLTRVRRFQQDDAHIFCRDDQIKQEVLGALDFMKTVYDIFGMRYKLELSTKPAKALGDAKLWEVAELQLAQALDEFAGEGQWSINPGDGAFYGPKIDIKVMDAMERIHQCATVQLDFQLPIRFELKYKGSESKDAEEESTTGEYKRPIIVHRAMLGSVERMIAVLIEHFGGKWPFWLSPRQALIVPVGQYAISYGHEAYEQIHNAGFYVDIEDSNKTLQKKIRDGQLAQYNFILVVGNDEMEHGTVNVRTRDNKQHGEKSISEVIQMFRQLAEDHH